MKYENRYGLVLLDAQDNRSLYKLLRKTRSDLHGRPFYVYHERNSIHTQNVYLVKPEHVTYVKIQTGLKEEIDILAGIETYMRMLELYKQRRGRVLSEIGLPRFRHLKTITSHSQVYLVELVTSGSKPDWDKLCVVTLTGELQSLFADFRTKERFVSLIVYLSVLRDIEYY